MIWNHICIGSASIEEILLHPQMSHGFRSVFIQLIQKENALKFLDGVRYSWLQICDGFVQKEDALRSLDSIISLLVLLVWRNLIHPHMVSYAHGIRSTLFEGTKQLHLSMNLKLFNITIHLCISLRFITLFHYYYNKLGIVVC